MFDKHFPLVITHMSYFALSPRPHGRPRDAGWEQL